MRATKYIRLLVLLPSLLLLACQNSVNFAVDPQTEQFGQQIAYNNKVDFIWIIDNSSSMTDKQMKLSAQLPEVLNTLKSLKLDYHMAFITTDVRDKSSPTDIEGNGGKFIGTPNYLTENSSDLLTQIQSRIVQGSSGSSLERGLLSLERVLDKNYLNGEGAGFLRKDALMVVNVLSDEEDKSNKPATYYRDLLNKVKPLGAGQPGGWILNFIGVLDLSGSCASNGYPDPGYIFMDLASWSGGRLGNICSANLVDSVGGIKERIIQILTDYHLASSPNLASIKVYINKVLIPENAVNGWTYVSDIKVIRFHGTAVPPADSEVVVDYKPDGAK